MAKVCLYLREVRVMATLMPAAQQSVARMGLTLGKMKQIARPKQAPAAKNGKMKPPRYPPATVNEMATSFAKPAMTHICHDVSSNPIKPLVGQTCGSSADGDREATVQNKKVRRGEKEW